MIFALAVFMFYVSCCMFRVQAADDQCKIACDEQCVSFTDPDLNKNCREQCEADEDKCQELNKKVKVYEDILKLNNKQQDALSNQIDYINQQQSQTQQKLQTVKTKLEDISKDIISLQRDIEDKEKNIAYQKKILASLMQTYYDYDQQGILKIVLANEEFSKSLTDQTDYIEQSGIKVGDVLTEIKNTQQGLIEDKERLENNYKESSQLEDNLQDQGKKLEASESQKQYLLDKTKEEEEKYKQLLASVQDEIYNIELRKAVDYSNVPPAKGGYFDYPLSTVKITQGYGMTSYAKAGAYGGKPHNGIDFGISSGNKVFAVRGGKVIKTGNNGRYAYGKWIAIDHGDGLVTLYGHLSSQSVSKGDNVETGEEIGKSGNTGNSTGPHLHFSVFSSRSFELVESKYVKGLLIPVGASINPKRYLE